ncbi:helix-turn-helix transcriptional regulator [Streptomyces misionensis]|uniref:helix-turn-helix domain-containing protein n=1 Tax=Streptomyces misionensis TaxID=67331 RepID=UPI003442214C
MEAQRAGVGQPTVSKVETGRMVPSPDGLDRLSRALGRVRKVRAARAVGRRW